MNYKKMIKKTIASLAVGVGVLATFSRHSSVNAYQVSEENGGKGNVQVYHKVHDYSWWLNINDNISIVKVNGEVVFCVEPATLVQNGVYYSSAEIQDGALIDHFGNTISQNQIDEIKNAIFWGWDMSSDKSGNQYLYVQSKIWDILGWTPQNFRGGNTWDGYSKVSDFVDGKLNNERATSWHKQTYTVKAGESITLTDNNQVFPYVSNPTDTKGWIFERISDSQLKITATKDSKDATFVFRPQALPADYSPASLLLTHGTSQNVVMFRDPDRLFSSITLNVVKKGNIKIVKTDDETGKPLAGVEFGLFEKGSTTAIATATTNDEGEAFFNDYDPKEFDIKETRTLETYRLNNQVYSVTVPAGDTVTVRATNVSKKYKVSISKHLDEALDGSGTRVPGKNIAFDLVDTNGNVVQTITTDEKGYAVSNDIPYTTSVTIVEHTPTGYQTPQPIKVQLDTNKDNHTYHYLVENNVKKSFLQLLKTDAETGKTIPASGVRFKLYKDGKQVSQQVTVPSLQTIDVFETDSNGQVTFPQQLSYGNYEIEEVQAPTGYVLSDKRLAVNISGDDVVVTVKFANTPQKGQLQITKTGSQIVSWVQDGNGVNVPNIQRVPLAGVKFELIKDGVVIEQATTDTNGIATFSNKPLGKYQYREISAPEGYVVDSTLHEITFTPQEQTVKVDSHSVSVHNERKTISVQFNKTFEESKYFKNEQKATFGLYTANDVEGLPANSLVGLAQVNGSGTYTFGNLPIDGEFYLKEITTGEAYSLNDSKIGVSTSFSTSGSPAQTVVVETPIVNEIKRGDHELVKVEANSKERLEGVEFKLVAVSENNGEVEVGRYTTDKDGRIIFKDLEYGNYYAQETKPLEGYLGNIQKLFFSIKGGEKVDKNDNSTEATATRTVVENERQPLIHTEATTASGGKQGYENEKHIEKAFLANLTIGKKYTVIATQYDSTGKVFATQEREFIADSETRTEIFEFTVPVGYTGDIVYGEDLYRDKEKVATHFDLKNDKQTVTVVRPELPNTGTQGSGMTILAGVVALIGALGLSKKREQN